MTVDKSQAHSIYSLYILSVKLSNFEQSDIVAKCTAAQSIWITTFTTLHELELLFVTAPATTISHTNRYGFAPLFEKALFKQSCFLSLKYEISE